MAKRISVKFTGGSAVRSAIDDLEAQLKDAALMASVAAMARVVYDEVKLNASPPRMGQKTGNLQTAIYRAFSPERSTSESKLYSVSWNATKAPHGHLLENGTSRAPAHPFVRPALSRLKDAIEAGREKMKKEVAEIVSGVGSKQRGKQ